MDAKKRRNSLCTALSVFITFCMVVGSVPATAYAEIAGSWLEDPSGPLATQGDEDGPCFDRDHVDLYVGEEVTLYLQNTDNVARCTAYGATNCVNIIASSDEATTFVGAFEGSGEVSTHFTMKDGTSCEVVATVTVLPRPKGYVYAQGTSGSVSWSVTNEGENNTLDIWPTNNQSGVLEDWSGTYTAPWDRVGACVTKVRIHPGTKTQTCEYMFRGMYQLTSVEGLQNLDTSSVESMERMFCDCRSLISVSGFSSLDLSSITNMEFMFVGTACTNLDLSNVDLSKMTGQNIFSGYGDPSVLESLTLSSNYRIAEGAYTYGQPIPNPTGGWPHTGKWIAEDEQYDPNGTAYTTEELIELYKSNPLTQTWVAQYIPEYIEQQNNGLDSRRRAVEQATTQQSQAQSELEQVNARVSAAQATYDTWAQKVGSALSKVDSTYAAWDQAKAEASEADNAVTAAQNALDQNASEIAQAQAALQQAQNAANGTAVSEATQRVANAESQVSDAQAEATRLEQALASETTDPGTNEGHPEWTALGLFQHIRDNSTVGSAAYWDAQCAIDILTSGTNSTGHTYAAYEGPVPDGNGASTWSEIYKKVNLASRQDAAALDNVAYGLDLVDAFNEHRVQENTEEGTNLSTQVGTNCRQMAISIVQCDASASQWGHTQAYNGLENLASGYSDPYYGWYDEEKAAYKAYIQQAYTHSQIVSNFFGDVGHYLTIVDQNSDTYANVVGGARYSGNRTTEISLRSIFNSQWNDVPLASISYTTQDFRDAWFDPYYSSQIDAGMKGTTQAVHNQHVQDLADARNALANAVAEKNAADEALTLAQAAQATAQSAVAAAQAHLDDVNGQTAGLQAALNSATSNANTAHSKANAAEQAYNNAVAELNLADPNGDAEKARIELQAAKDAQAAAAEKSTAAQNALAAAQAELDNYTNLSTSPVINISYIDNAIYDGAAHTPQFEVTATLSDSTTETLIEGLDYSVAYIGNVQAGTATVRITGLSQKGSGNWWGTRTATFSILPKSLSTARVTLLANAAAYNGASHKPVISSVVDGIKPLNPSDYQVAYKRSGKVTNDFVSPGTIDVIVTGAGNYIGSAKATFTITAPTTGWVKENGTWFYYVNSSKATGWQKVGSTWYYLDPSSGAMATGWLKLGSTWYYFNGSGAMATGWQKVGSAWYYFNGSGAMVTGWLKLGSAWYYFNGSGAMVTGWLKLGSAWYYFNGSGAMVTGWLKLGSTWYYFNGSGAMVTGWLKLGSTWYYFNGSGAMLTGRQNIGGKWYTFASSGAWVA